MGKKEYVVQGRFWAKRVCIVEAASSSEAMKLARKLQAKEWMVAEIRVSSDLTARQRVKASSPLKERLKNEIDLIFQDDGE